MKRTPFSSRFAMRRVITALAVLVTITLVLGSCASYGFAGGAEGDYYAEQSYDMAEESFTGGAVAPAGAPVAATERSAAPAPTSALVIADSLDTPAGAVAQVPEQQDSEQETPQPQRMRVYSADLELVVASVPESRDRIIGTVERSGGYVESSQADLLVVRVPAARFDVTLGEIEAEGSVRSRAVRTADVTDQFTDLQRRLAISEASRERLLELLERTEDSDERVSILRDIRRLTEEIEQLRATLESISQMVRFSRITIRLISRIQESGILQQAIPFRWIAQLSPLGISTRDAESEIEIVPDDSFAVFNSGHSLFAEAADGTQFRAGVVTNDPRGNEAFWQEALVHNLEAFYRSVEAVETGEYRGVLLQSKDREPFWYLVVVSSRDEELVVVESFFPSVGEKETRLGDVLAAVAGGAE